MDYPAYDPKTAEPRRSVSDSSENGDDGPDAKFVRTGSGLFY